MASDTAMLGIEWCLAVGLRRLPRRGWRDDAVRWLSACRAMTRDAAIDGIFLDGNIKALEPGYLARQIGPTAKKNVLAGYAPEAKGPSNSRNAWVLECVQRNECPGHSVVLPFRATAGGKVHQCLHSDFRFRVELPHSRVALAGERDFDTPRRKRPPQDLVNAEGNHIPLPPW